MGTIRLFNIKQVSVCLSYLPSHIHPSVHQSIHSFNPPFFHPSIHLSIPPFTAILHPSVHHFSIYASIYHNCLAYKMKHFSFLKKYSSKPNQNHMLTLTYFPHPPSVCYFYYSLLIEMHCYSISCMNLNSFVSFIIVCYSKTAWQYHTSDHTLISSIRIYQSCTAVYSKRYWNTLCCCDEQCHVSLSTVVFEEANIVLISSSTW